MDYHGREHWDTVHSVVGDGAGVAAAAVARSAARLLALGPGAVVVDIAGGSGPFLRALPRAAVGVRVDFALGPLRAGTGVCGDALALPLRTGSADAATLLSAWWAMPDIDRVVAEAARVLRPGGALLVHIWGPAERCRLITVGASCVATAIPSMFRPPGVRGPFESTVGEVAAVLRDAGLDDIAAHAFGHSWPLGAADDYWAEFAHLAPTSHAAFRDAAPDARARVRRLLDGLLLRLRRDGVADLSLAWNLVVARKRPVPARFADSRGAVS
ncbi:hypothetical protein GCM10010171_17400 [Actinokineospora fastidiosa]|uniref:Methyltransferase type 11 domain-containing protein n=2 Tax=Actinokineospora fastidiosa TaxID=1816 RepID=A0A918LAV3_9PSEU|nr:hypothetical protein GCM10010171_17400 [Actinokineospora fastidiosa]